MNIYTHFVAFLRWIARGFGVCVDLVFGYNTATGVGRSIT